MWVSLWEYVAVNVGTPGNLKKELDPLELELQVIGSHSWFVLETQLASSARRVRNSYPQSHFSSPPPLLYMLHFPAWISLLWIID